MLPPHGIDIIVKTSFLVGNWVVLTTGKLTDNFDTRVYELGEL